MKRIAVIDLGTNTFHLLIVGIIGDGKIVTVYREKEYVQLGERGLRHIGKAAFHRGMTTIKKFGGILKLFDVKDYRAFATAAIRTADNASVFVRRVHRETGIEIRTISGEEEASYIYEGVLLSGALDQSHNLIMDIGGGSVEFIIGSKQNIFETWSLEIGASVLFNKFGGSNPISKSDSDLLSDFLTLNTPSLSKAIELYQPVCLIGSAGTFDVLSEAIGVATSDKYKSIPRKDYRIFCDRVMILSYEERVIDPQIPEKRADFIQVSLLLIEHIISLGSFNQIKASPYSMKEGMISEMVAERPLQMQYLD